VKPELDCQRCQAFLPLYVAGTLPPTERQTVAEHLASCADCQAELSQWQQIAQAVRSPLRQPHPALTFAEARLQLRTRLAESATGSLQGAPSMSTLDESQHTSARRIPLPHSTRRSYPIVAGGLLVIALVATLIFVIPRFHSSGTVPSGSQCSATQTTSAIPHFGSLTDLSFTSSGDGWGVGYIWNPTDSALPQSLIVHLHDCRWQPDGAQFAGVMLMSVAMVSPNEGWALGVTAQVSKGGHTYTVHFGKLVLLHDAGGRWQPAAFPDLDATQLTNSPIVRMVSADDGWILVQLSSTQVNIQPVLLHLHQGTWQTVALPDSVTSTTNFTALSTVSPDACWLLGGDGRQAFIDQYQQGVWSQWKAPPGASLSTLQMTSATSGVAIGFPPNTQGRGFISLLRVTFTGTTWQTDTLAISDYPLIDLRESAWVPPNDLWVFGISDQNTSDVMLHLHGQHVVAEPLPASGGTVETIKMLSPTKGWAIANIGIAVTSSNTIQTGVLWYYHDGVWTAIQNKG
jgi:hypothetical protein